MVKSICPPPPTLLSSAQLSESLMGFVVALDMTDRTLQNQLKAAQLPWTLAKAFDTACPVSRIMPCSVLPPELLLHTPTGAAGSGGDGAAELWLRVNGVERQRGQLSDMIHRPADLIAYISKRMRLEPGDLILTGTPAGVGPVRSGDILTAGLGGMCQMKFTVQ